MELPSSRELELETLLRQRETQLTELSDEVAHLRHYLPLQPGPSTTDAVTLPPALTSILLPRLNASTTAIGAGSSTVAAALTQRTRLLQEENDELYELLKLGETGKLKEEVRGLRRVVDRLEGALRESHKVITNLSTELDKSYDSFMASARQNNSTKAYSQSPRNSYHPMPHSGPSGNGSATSKLPPTGPRAYKKPRLSETQTSPPARPNSSLPHHKHHGHTNNSRVNDGRDYAPRNSSESRGKSNHVKMDVDEDQRIMPPSPGEHDRERERERDRERGGREHDRGRERDRDGGKVHRRHNFSGGPPSRGSGRRAERAVASNSTFSGGDRTLAERMGL